MKAKNPDALKIQDELDLSSVKIPKDVIFPDEVNRYLRDQVGVIRIKIYLNILI